MVYTQLEDAVVLLSGGMDSAVVLALAKSAYKRVFTIFFDYGQHSVITEAQCARLLSDHYKATKRVEFDLTGIFDSIRSPLTTSIEDVPDHLNEVPTGVPSTYVPFRNTQFIIMAAAWAEANGLVQPHILLGATAGSRYPDCQLDYIIRMNKLLASASNPKCLVIVRAPIINKTKAEIACIGVNRDVPFQMTWSCYVRGHKKGACGKCTSCVARKEAFAEADKKDLGRVEDRIDYNENGEGGVE